MTKKAALASDCPPKEYKTYLPGAGHASEPAQNRARNSEVSSTTSGGCSSPQLVNAARATMGSIDLDPASSALAQSIVQAKRYLTRAESGFDQHWEASTVFLNPPGGISHDLEKIRQYQTDSNIGQWFRRAIAAHKAGEFEQMIFVSSQLSLLRTCQEALYYPICIPAPKLISWFTPEELRERERRKSNANSNRVERHVQKCLKSLENHIDSPLGLLVPSQGPAHDSVIVYLPPLRYIPYAVRNFEHEFQPIGQTKI